MNNDFTNALLKSSGLHIALIVFLVIGSFFKPSTPTVMEVTLNAPANPNEPEEQAIEAVSVDQQAVEQRIQELKKQDAAKKAAETKRIRDLERRATNAKKQREAEARRIAKLEKERKRKEREKQKADAAAREAKKNQQAEQKKAADAKKQAEELAKQRKLEEEKLKQAEAKRKADAEAARQKALAEKMMQEQLAAEAAARNRARQTQVLSEVEKYTALIIAKIQQNLIVDDNMKGKVCRLNLRLAFNGLVTDVKQLSGDQQVCEAAIRAVRRVETLPVSKDKAVFEKMKDINLNVQPKV